jgi:hypothetical protein
MNCKRIAEKQRLALEKEHTRMRKSLKVAAKEPYPLRRKSLKKG